VYFCGWEVSINILSDYATCGAAEGNFKEYSSTFQTASQLAIQFNHPRTQLYLKMQKIMASYFCRQQLNMEEIKELVDILKPNPLFCGPIQVLQGLTSMEQGDIENGKRLFNEGIGSFMEFVGEGAEILFSLFYFQAFMKMKDYDRGIDFVNQILKKIVQLKVDGAYGIGEIYRVKAEFMMLKYQTELTAEQSYEIERLLKLAISEAQSIGNLMVELRSWCTLAQYYKSYGTKEQRQNTIESIKKVNSCVRNGELSPDYNYSNQIVQELASLSLSESC